jgi:signal transduction histidine kinase
VSPSGSTRQRIDPATAISAATLVAIAVTAMMPQPVDIDRGPLYLTLAIGAVAVAVAQPRPIRRLVLRISPLLSAVVLVLVVAMTGGQQSLYTPTFGVIPLAAALSAGPRRVFGAGFVAAMGAAVPLLYEPLAPEFVTELMFVLIIWGGLVYIAASRSQHIRSLAAQSRRYIQFRSQILTAISHQVRTPLTVVKAASFTLSHQLDKLDRPMVIQLAARLHVQAERLDGHLAKLLALTESGPSAELRLARRDLVTLATSTVERLRLADRVTVVADGPVVAKVDEARMSIVFEQLLVNAVRYTPTDRPIRVEVRQDRRRVRVVVEDQGPGIPRRLRRAMMEPFTIGPRRDVDPNPTMGVGLALVQGYVSDHGGTVRLESAEGNGLRVAVLLPGAQRRTLARPVGLA